MSQTQTTRISKGQTMNCALLGMVDQVRGPAVMEQVGSVRVVVLKLSLDHMSQQSASVRVMTTDGKKRAVWVKPSCLTPIQGGSQ